MKSMRSLLSLLIALCVASQARAQMLKADGPDYYQPGEAVDGIGTIMPCRIPDKALQSAQALNDWVRWHAVNNSFRGEAEVVAGSLIWQESDIAVHETWIPALTKAIRDCVEAGRCDDPTKGRFGSKENEWRKKGKSKPYKRYFLKTIGNTPPDEMAAQRYLHFGACSIPRRVELAAYLSDYVTGDFPESACDFALEAAEKRYGMVSDTSYLHAVRWSQGRDSFGKIAESLEASHACPVLTQSAYLQLSGSIKPGESLDAVARRMGSAAIANRNATRAAEKKASEAKRAAEAAAEPGHVARFKANLVAKYGDRSPRYLDSGICDDVRSHLFQARAGVFENRNRTLPSDVWMRIYNLDAPWACAHIDPEAVGYTFWQKRQIAASRPAQTTGPDIGQVISEGSAEWARQQAAKLECEKKYGFGNSVCK